MNNILLSAAIGLDPKQVEFFIKSFKKYSDDLIYFLIGKKDYDLKEKLKLYNCSFYEVDDHKHDIQLNRYKYFFEILRKEENYKNVLISDCRDLYFQTNPFDYPYKGTINFFLEDIKINKCSVNSKWLRKTFGKKIYTDLSQKTVCCSGTVLGTQKAMINYLELMNQMIKKYPYKKSLKYLLTLRRDKEGRGCDQGYCNFIAHKNYLKNCFFYSNNNGPIATVLYLKNIDFNEKLQLLNREGKAYCVVHQYDKRWSEFSEKVNKIKKNLELI